MKKCKICLKLDNKNKTNNLTKKEVLRWNVVFIDGEDGYPLKNKDNNAYQLWKCADCNIFWEIRPLYDDSMYGGSPGEYVKVSEEYVKEHYPDFKEL